MENVKDYIIPDLMKSMNDALLNRSDNTKLEGYYIGEVVDVDDPERLGRCRIRVANVFGIEVPDDELPWAVPEFSFIGSLKSSFIVPPVNTIVYVRFDLGEIYLPMYGAKVLNTEQLPTNKDDDYPNNIIFFETDNGDKCEINVMKRTAFFEHASGSKIYVDDETIDIEQNSGNKVNITNKEIVIEHFSGSTITLDSIGDITIDSIGNIKTKHGLFLDDNGSFVIPMGQGPYMALPACPYSGMMLTGQKCAPGGP